MNNVLLFKNSSKSKTESPKPTLVNQELSKEDYEFLEDMIANMDMASEEEVMEFTEDGFCITKNGEVKVSPNNSFYKYIKSKNQQKRINHLNQNRKNILKLI